MFLFVGLTFVLFCWQRISLRIISQFNIPVHIHLNNFFSHRNCLWILGHEPTLRNNNSTWSYLVKDAAGRDCLFNARDDNFLARTMDEFRGMQNSQVTDNVLRQNNECHCAPNAQLPGDNCATRPDEAQVVEPAHAEQVEGAAEKTWQVNSRKRDQPAGQFARGEQLTDEEVVESAHVEQVHLSQFSPSPSRKRACLSQFASGAQLTDEVAALDEDPPVIVRLEGLSQLAEAVARTPVLDEGVNLYEQARSARDERFWSCVHMDLYNNIFNNKKCTDHKWINWTRTRRHPAMQHIEEACRDVGLHGLMAIKQVWHVETIKQFYSTFYVDPSRTSLTWMTGTNKKITVSKKFCQKVLHVPSEHTDKILDSLTETQKEWLTSRTNNEYLKLVNLIIRMTIDPKIGDGGKIYGLSAVLAYHILSRKRFDIIDMMFKQMEKNFRHSKKTMIYAPYIMLLINHAFEDKFVPESGGKEYSKHKKHNMELKLPKEPKGPRASKSKVIRVPLMNP